MWPSDEENLSNMDGWKIYAYLQTKTIFIVNQILDFFPALLDSPSWIILLATILIVSPLIWLLVKLIQWIRQPLDSIQAVKEFVVPSADQRFRKRDKIEFVARRMSRNVKAVGSLIRGGQGKKRRAMSRLVRKVFSKGSPEFQSQQSMPGLPDEYLEEETDSGRGEDEVPRTLLIVLKNLRVFGHFDNKIFVDLMKDIDYLNLKAHDSLFKVGEHDENMYIVDSGSINVFSTTRDPRTNEVQTHVLKKVRQGEAIFSLLSFVEYLGGRRKLYKTVSAKATEETRVIKISFKSFKKSFDNYPETLAKVVQVVMVRLQRVTLLALHQYLGLGVELLTPSNRSTTKQQRQTSQRAQDLDQDLRKLKQQMASPESESATTESADLNSAASLLFSSVIIQSRQEIDHMNHEKLRRLAKEAFLEVLNLSDEQLPDNLPMSEYININESDEGDTLVMEDSNDSPSLMLVLSGTVELSQINPETNEASKIHKAMVGGILCQLQTLTNEPSFYTVKATMKDTKVARLDAKYIHQCMLIYPHVAMRLAMSVIDNLSPYVRSIDFALEWLQLESGKALYKQNDEANSTYVVLSGRLRSVIRQENSKKTLVAEYGRGDLIGIVETLLNTSRKTTVIAVRDSEVAKIPAGLIDAIKTRYPVVLLRLLKLLGEKLQQSWEDSNDPIKANPVVQSNFSTVAVIAISPNIPSTAFCFELLHPLIRIDPTLRLTKDYVFDELGPAAFDKTSDFKLTEWLASQEDNHRIVIYQCEPELTHWTKLCIRHADVIFILTDPKDNSNIKPLERDLESLSRRTRKEMIFLHSEDTKYPEGTSEWLKKRNWINAHYHIKCPRRMSSRKTKYTKILNGPPPDVHSDFSRMARYITGESVGIVLGGGGARGLSHIGMIKSTLEAGIPIDHVAGVSIGALIGGLYAVERDLREVTLKARSFSTRFAQQWRHALDFTYPYAAYFTGNSFNGELVALFGERDILDAWLPFFTVTTDITCSAMRIHDYGSLWRYVRGSMSLAGYLPPICDPRDGHLLLDGGYTNNLPADIMRSRGSKHILAIDVGSIDSVTFTNYGDSLNGWKVLFSKWNPFGKAMNVPSQAEIQSRLAYVSCVGKLESVKAAGYCEYIRPPIDKYSTMQFGAFEEIKEVGYRHGETFFKGLKKAGLMRLFYWWDPSKQTQSQSMPGMLRRGSLNASTSNLLGTSHESDHGSPGNSVPTHMPFERIEPSSQLSDLAKMVCAVQLPVTRGHGGYDSDDDPYEDLNLTDEDSENLISDEEDDKESGFLSQI